MGNQEEDKSMINILPGQAEPGGAIGGGKSEEAVKLGDCLKDLSQLG